MTHHHTSAARVPFADKRSMAPTAASRWLGSRSEPSSAPDAPIRECLVESLLSRQIRKPLFIDLPDEKVADMMATHGYRTLQPRRRGGVMYVRMMKRSAIGAVLVFAGVTFMSERASAAELQSRLDDCSATCSSGGCSASTAWYAFWDNCICGCGPGGQASCSCG